MPFMGAFTQYSLILSHSVIEQIAARVVWVASVFVEVASVHFATAAFTSSSPLSGIALLRFDHEYKGHWRNGRQCNEREVNPCRLNGAPATTGPIVFALIVSLVSGDCIASATHSTCLSSLSGAQCRPPCHHCTHLRMVPASMWTIQTGLNLIVILCQINNATRFLRVPILTGPFA